MLDVSIFHSLQDNLARHVNHENISLLSSSMKLGTAGKSVRMSQLSEVFINGSLFCFTCWIVDWLEMMRRVQWNISISITSHSLSRSDSCWWVLCVKNIVNQKKKCLVSGLRACRYLFNSDILSRYTVHITCSLSRSPARLEMKKFNLVNLVTFSPFHFKHNLYHETLLFLTWANMWPALGKGDISHAMH